MEEFYIIILYILLIVSFETVAMSCFKGSVQKTIFPDWRFFLAGVVCYAIVGILLVQTFKLSGLAVTNALWSGLSVIATTTVGILLFKETIHMHDVLAILLISTGLIILKLTN
jgi:multidrug transporter EmrE-like cation transporter